VETIASLASQLPGANRVTVGMPGMIRHGVVIATPHYITKDGPRSKVLPDLVEAWGRFDMGPAVSRALGIPSLVLNDAEVAGAGVVTGHGLDDVFDEFPAVRLKPCPAPAYLLCTEIRDRLSPEAVRPDTGTDVRQVSAARQVDKKCSFGLLEPDTPLLDCHRSAVLDDPLSGDVAIVPKFADAGRGASPCRDHVRQLFFREPL